MYYASKVFGFFATPSNFVILAGLAGAALFSTPARAQYPAQPYGSPSRAQSNMGGGFIEFLFGGGQSGAQPRTREQPADPLTRCPHPFAHRSSIALYRRTKESTPAVV